MRQRACQILNCRRTQDTAKSGFKQASIRLREGEYQYSLAKAIASFHFELRFPDVKDIINRLYGEQKANDLQFVRKVQTVLKKMEKSDIVSILPKSKPWELQRYSLNSFKFEDSDKNSVIFATEEQVEEMQKRLLVLHSAVKSKETVRKSAVFLVALGFLTVASYGAVVWILFRPVIEPVFFITALGVSVFLSLSLGELLARGSHKAIKV
jgi:hypothetical protein